MSQTPNTSPVVEQPQSGPGRTMRYPLGCLVITTLAFLSPFGTPVGLSSAKQQPAAKGKPAAKDAFGDPLPDHVFYRLGSVRLRYDATALIFSADGSQLLSQGYTPGLRVWDVATGRIVRQFAAAPEGRTALIASPDDRYLAYIRGNSYQALLLDKATGKELTRSEAPAARLMLAFSRDSKELIALTREQTIVKWDTAQRKEIARIKLDISNVDLKEFGDHCWHLSPDGGTVAFMPDVAKGTPRRPWHFWDTTTGKQSRPPLKAKVSPSQMCWSPDGRMIAVVASDNTVQVWDTVAGKQLALEAGNRQEEGSSYTTRGAAFHPQGKLLAIAIDGTVSVWEVEAGKKLWGKAMSGDILAFSPDGKTLAVGGSGIIHLVKTATGEPVGFTRRDPGWFNLIGWERSRFFLKDGRSFTVHDPAGISQVETATGKRLRTYDARNHGWYSYGFLCNQRSLFACLGADKHDAAQLFMFEAATGKELWRRPGQSSRIYFAADGKKIAAVSWKEDVFTMLDAATGREVKKVSVHSYKNGYSTHRAVSDDLNLIATTKGNLYKIDLWDLDTGKKLRTLDGPEGHGEMFFLSGSRLIVAAPNRDYDARAEKRDWTRIWEVVTGRIVQSFEEPMLKMSDDGRWLALQGDKSIAIRHLQTGRQVATVGGVDPLAFSPDGSLLVVRNESWHEVGLWDTFTGRQVGHWVEPLSEFHGAAFSPDGRTLVLTVRSGGSMLDGDVMGRATEPGKVPPQKLTPAEADRYWNDLTSDDGSRSHQARWSLVAGGDHTVKMLQRTVPRVEPLDAKNLAALLTGLNSGSSRYSR